MRKSTLFALATLALSVTPALAEPGHPGSSLSTREVVRDRNGNMTGSIERNNKSGDSTFRDRENNKTGSARIEQGHTVFRDREGFKQGTIGR